MLPLQRKYIMAVFFCASSIKGLNVGDEDANKDQLKPAVMLQNIPNQHVFYSTGYI